MAGTSPPPTSSPPTRPVVQVTPVRRLLSLAIAGFAALLTVGLVFGAQTAGVGPARIPYAIVIFGIQLLFVLAYLMALRPPGMPVVAGVGAVTALAADLAVTVPRDPEIATLGYVAAGGFIAATAGQLFRREGRLRVTESLAASLVIAVGVLAYATLILLTRLPSGTQAILVCLTAAGVAMVVARVVDTAATWPRLAPQVPRGALGVVLGAMAGTLQAGVLGVWVVGFSPATAAMVGLVGAVAAVLADLSVGYAEAGRGHAPEPPTMWVARHLQGPLTGFGLAAPLVYLLSVIYLVPQYS